MYSTGKPFPLLFLSREILRASFRLKPTSFNNHYSSRFNTQASGPLIIQARDFFTLQRPSRRPADPWHVGFNSDETRPERDGRTHISFFLIPCSRLPALLEIFVSRATQPDPVAPETSFSEKARRSFLVMKTKSACKACWKGEKKLKKTNRHKSKKTKGRQGDTCQ